MVSKGIGEGYLHCTLFQIVSTLESNHLSVKKLTNQGYIVIFRGNSCIIMNGSHILYKGKLTNYLHHLKGGEMVITGNEENI